jgi:hypothetical protein
MPWVLQMAGCALTLVCIAFVIWVGFWFFLALIAIGLTLASWRRIRRFLVDKGILNPVPGVPNGVIIEEEITPQTTKTIEGDYKRLDSE